MTDEICEICGGHMVEKTGRFGKYLACENYPTCKNTRSINKVVGKCPECGADVVERISKKGKTFYSCSAYPKCQFISWDIPTGEKCPKCNGYLVKKVFKNKEFIKCSNKDCDYQKDE